MRRVSAVDLMLLGTVLLWALNVTRHAVRRSRTASIRSPTRRSATSRRDPLLVASRGSASARSGSRRATCRSSLLAARADLRQPALLRLLASTTTSASTVGAHPRDDADLRRDDRDADRARAARPPFWIAAGVSFVGVALVAAGASGGFSGNLVGDLLAVRDGRDLGRLLGRDRAADAALLAVPDQLARARARLGAARARRASRRSASQTSTSAR